MTKVTRFTNDPPQSPYAPIWDYCIAEKKIDIDVEELAKVILLKESEIIKEYPGCDDGDTGLGLDSLTARFNYFNVLQWDSPVCEELHKEIRGFHAEYAKNTIGNLSNHQFFKEGGELKVRCWANVMRKGQQIKKHFHSFHPHCYLSGHFTVQCDDTSTVYYHPYHSGSYPFKNSPNNMTLFPTWVPHSTDKHESDVPRITIAFDILLHNAPNLVANNVVHDGELVTL